MPLESHGWFELLRPELSESDQLAFTYSNYNYRISILCSRMRSFVMVAGISTESGPLRFASLLAEADELLYDVHISSTQRPRQPTPRCSMHITNIFRAALLKLQHFLILLLDHEPYPPVFLT